MIQKTKERELLEMKLKKVGDYHDFKTRDKRLKYLIRRVVVNMNAAAKKKQLVPVDMIPYSIRSVTSDIVRVTRNF